MPDRADGQPAPVPQPGPGNSMSEGGRRPRASPDQPPGRTTRPGRAIRSKRTDIGLPTGPPNYWVQPLLAEFKFDVTAPIWPTIRWPRTALDGTVPKAKSLSEDSGEDLLALATSLPRSPQLICRICSGWSPLRRPCTSLVLDSSICNECEAICRQATRQRLFDQPLNLVAMNRTQGCTLETVRSIWVRSSPSAIPLLTRVSHDAPHALRTASAVLSLGDYRSDTARRNSAVTSTPTARSLLRSSGARRMRRLYPPRRPRSNAC